MLLLCAFSDSIHNRGGFGGKNVDSVAATSRRDNAGTGDPAKQPFTLAP